MKCVSPYISTQQAVLCHLYWWQNKLKVQNYACRQNCSLAFSLHMGNITPSDCERTGLSTGTSVCFDLDSLQKNLVTHSMRNLVFTHYSYILTPTKNEVRNRMYENTVSKSIHQTVIHIKSTWNCTVNVNVSHTVLSNGDEKSFTCNKVKI
jgi:hypothetical protein